jgi:hypothetical protein
VRYRFIIEPLRVDTLRMERFSMTGDNSGPNRRTVLRYGTLAGAGLALSLGSMGSAVAQTSDPQGAIDNASPGDTVVVADGTYDGTLTVDVENLTVVAENRGGATISGADSTIGTAVSIEADGVTFEGFEVTNPGGLLGIKIQPDFDDVTVTANTIDDIGPTGRLGVTGIVVGQGNHDGIDISNNTIRNLDQETTEDSGFPTVNGILFDADNSDPGTLSNSSVNNNRISSLESDIAPLGIVVQHETDGLSINANRISGLVAADDTDSDQSDGVDFGFTFAQGINIASPSTSDTDVNANVIEDITSAETIFPEAIKIDGDGGGVQFRSNQFLVAVGLNNRNGTDGGNRDPSGDPVVDARNNYWGSREGPELAEFNQDADDDDRADVVGNVDFEPFRRNPPGRGRGNGRGN